MQNRSKPPRHTRGPQPPRAPHTEHRDTRVHPKTFNAPELKVAGKNACRALFLARPDDVRRVYITEANIPAFGDLLKWCAQHRIAYHVKTDADLDQIAETVHHDGICLIARERSAPNPESAVRAVREGRAGDVVVLLEDVKNPHNLGAILRVCAHFGVRVVLAAGETPALSPAAMRTAEGGAEHCEVVPIGAGANAVRVVDDLRASGFRVVATSSHTKNVLGDVDMPRRAIVLFGSEGSGLSRALLDRADVSVAIPGSGALESLNVACASSVILWELWRKGKHNEDRSQPDRGRRRR